MNPSNPTPKPEVYVEVDTPWFDPECLLDYPAFLLAPDASNRP